LSCERLGRPVFKVGPSWAGIWELEFQEVPTYLTETEWLPVSKLCKQYGLYWIAAFLLGIWNLVQARHVQPPIKTQGSEPNYLPRLATFHTSPLIAGRGPLEACAWLPLDFHPGTFFFNWFCFISFCCNKS
jgi:hypothetical protein